MDFLRLHLPRLHQALRGALDSFSTLVSYLVGDAVPTVERETQAAEELGEVAAGKRGKAAEEEAQEGLRDSHSGGLGGPGQSGGPQVGSSASARSGEWGANSSHESQADRQDPGTREAAQVAGGQEPSAPLAMVRETEPGPGDGGGGGSPALGSQEPGEQEMSREETRSTWEQEEEEKEEEEVRAPEPGVARGAESQLTWHQEPEGRADADGQKVAEDLGETEQGVEEAFVETKGPEAKGAGREEEVVIVVRGGQGARAPGTQGPRAESAGREDARAASGGEVADILGIQEREWEAVPGAKIPEPAGRVWVLAEASKGDQEGEVDEEGEAEGKHVLTQTQALGTEDQRAERGAAGAQEPEEAEEGLEVEDEQHRKEAEQWPDWAVGAAGPSLEEGVQAEEAQGEQGSCRVTEVMPALPKEAEGEEDLEAAPEARPGEGFMGERSEEVPMSQEALREKGSEGQQPQLMGGTQTPAEHPEPGQRGQEELERVPDPSQGEAQRGPEEPPKHLGSAGLEVPEAEAWGNQKDVESRHSQERRTAAEGREEEAEGGQALEAEAQGRLESDLPEVLGCGAKDREAPGAENQELEESQGTEAATGQPLGESEAEENKAGEVEAKAPWEADRTPRGGWKLAEVALSLQGSKDTQPSPLPAESMEDKEALGLRPTAGEERPGWEAGAAWEGGFDRGPASQDREEAREGAELVEAAEGEKEEEQEMGLGSSAEWATSPGGQAEAGEEEQAETEGPEVAGRLDRLGSVTLGSQAPEAGDPVATAETEKPLEEQMLVEEEVGGGRVREQRGDSEGWRGDPQAEGKAQRPLDAEGVVAGGRRTEAQETDPEGLEDKQGLGEQATPQVPTEVVSEVAETAEAVGSGGGDIPVPGGWSEPLLPGSRLDVSVPRSRVLLSRSSSQRRSRPSFRRTPAPKQQEDPPCLQPQEGLEVPEQQPLQPEEAPEPSPPKPGGTPVPARRRPVGHGFGLAHPGMMQELQARLGRPKPE